MLTTVVVVTWRGAAHITDCLDALAAQRRPHVALVVDNASDDGTAELLRRHPTRPKVLRLSRNTGFAGGIAAALSVVDTPFVAWLNDDAVPAPGWLAALEEAMAADVAAVGSRLEYGDGGLQSLGVRLTRHGYGADLTAPAEPFGFCGGAALLRTDVLRDAGGVPADFFCYYEDTDTAWRLRLAGWRVAVEPNAVVRHRHGASTNPGSAPFHRWNERNRLLMLLRCAPAGAALRELARFCAITATLPVRGRVPPAPNYRVGLRCRVLVEVVTALPATLRQRFAIGRRRTIGRAEIWRKWACQ
ncbi:GT2 family glycosyltransferase [Saccharomonospora amisosensis]|uniref:GT2 family glycosyltransferase n=1 Tax=Saccharomonospora amisosensis TaxID=1128677 RepID=A0A7X5ZT40_9PSEU|nr:glycosyltransferase family 2 protein [Saccharomonospora amisosensis]NIJ14005.1 GT2 family glycosyltransferase [Saccharomonospora amisosensis]